MVKKKQKEKGAFWAKRKSRLGAVILLAVTFSLLLFVVAPFEIYCNNIAEMAFSVKEFIGGQLLFALVLAVIVFCILFFVPNAVYEYAYPLLIGWIFMFFLQSNYLNIGMTSLAGDQMGDQFSTWTYIWNTSLWVLVPTGFVVAYKLIKQKTITQLVALVLTIAICATQLMNFTVGAISTEAAFKPAIDRVYGKYADKPRFLTNKDIEKVGEDKNVIVFCVDRFDSVLYAEPAMKKYPEAFEFLNDGFTYYNDMLSLYGYTFPSVGFMMSGIEYNHEDTHKEYFDKVYNQNKTLSALHDAGYSIHLYSESYYDYSNANELPNYIGNAIETDRETLKTEVRKQLNFNWAFTKMSLYRTLPFFMKGLVGGVNSDTCNDRITYTSDDLGGYEVYKYGLKSVRDYINAQDGNFQTKGDKNFSFIHVSGCHDASYDKNWNKKKGSIETQSDVLISAMHSMNIIGTYIENLKSISEDLYKNSTIIILGDHGKVENRLKDFDDPMLTALFVKPAGVSGTPMQTSSAPVAQENLWATIFESEGLAYDTEFFAPSVFTVEEQFNLTGIYPERKVSWTKRIVGMTSYDLVEYKINGNARDFDNWEVYARKHYNHALFNN